MLISASDKVIKDGATATEMLLLSLRNKRARLCRTLAYTPGDRERNASVYKAAVEFLENVSLARDIVLDKLLSEVNFEVPKVMLARGPYNRAAKLVLCRKMGVSKLSASITGKITLNKAETDTLREDLLISLFQSGVGIKPSLSSFIPLDYTAMEAYVSVIGENKGERIKHARYSLVDGKVAFARAGQLVSCIGVNNLPAQIQAINAYADKMLLLLEGLERVEDAVYDEDQGVEYLDHGANAAACVYEELNWIAGGVASGLAVLEAEMTKEVGFSWKQQLLRPLKYADGLEFVIGPRPKLSIDIRSGHYFPDLLQRQVERGGAVLGHGYPKLTTIQRETQCDKVMDQLSWARCRRWMIKNTDADLLLICNSMMQNYHS